MINISRLPITPGVYLFKDKSQKIIYIGKAINLRKRVKSYFTPLNSKKRTDNLLKNIYSVSFEKVSSELEALLLEARLIKLYRPKYNHRLQDDKRYLYIGISKEKIPRIYLLRQPEKEKKLSNWYGPFISSQSTREIMRLMRRIFPYRSCKKIPKKTCLYYQLKLCPGFCQYQEKEKQYRQTLKEIRLFLSGEIGFLRKNLISKMKALAKINNFEEAQKVKDQFQAIETTLHKFKKIPEEEDVLRELSGLKKILIKYQGIDPLIIHRLEAYDVANLGRDLQVAAMVVFIQGEPQPKEYRRFKIKANDGGDPGAIKEVLHRRLAHSEWLYPQLILIDGGKPQLSSAFKVFNSLGLANQIGLLGLVKEKEEIFLPLYHQRKIVGWKKIPYSRKITGLKTLQYARDEAHRFAHRYYQWRQRQAALPSWPEQKLKDQKSE